MYETLNEPIEVIALFEAHALKPLRFKWKNRVYHVSRVTGTWKVARGENSIRHFAVVDRDTNVFELTYDEFRTDWSLARVWVE